MNVLRQYHAWRGHRRTRCRITEEWCGSFIGRRYCRTHQHRWDTGGPCPKEGTE